MARELNIGITGSGVCHRSMDPTPDVDTQFQMVKECGAFDYFDKTPAVEERATYIAASEKHDLPIRAGGWYYTLGKDEDLLRTHLRLAHDLGSLAQNVQIGPNHADGTPLSDQALADAYCEFHEYGQGFGVDPCFEIHVNMWSEDFRRVIPVAELVEKRGLPYYMTLDHSHVIFKMDNPEEQEIFNIRPDVESGALILDPFVKGNISEQWIERGYVRHCHARAAAPNGPKNVWAEDQDSGPGRGIQYPFVEPGEGEWHSAWDAKNLEPWKEVIRMLLRYHAREQSSPLLQISTEFIPFRDYGEGAQYSIFEQGVACAKWMRDEWDATLSRG